MTNIEGGDFVPNPEKRIADLTKQPSGIGDLVRENKLSPKLNKNKDEHQNSF